MSAQEVKTSLLKEFRAWLLKEEYFDEDEMQYLLEKPWDGAYPGFLLGDDLKTDIGNFLYYMAEFAVEKVYGEKYWNDGWEKDKDGNFIRPIRTIRIVPDPSYEDRSEVYVLEMVGNRILAVGCGCKTWNHNPEDIEQDLRELIAQLEKSRA